MRQNAKTNLHLHFIKIPRWPVTVSFILLGALYSFLTEELTVGPGWLLLPLVGLLILLVIFSVLSQNHALARFLALFTTSLITLALLVSVILMLKSLVAHTIPPTSLIRDAMVLWTSNVLTFGIWYWQVDRGGPALRHSDKPGEAELLFPQMTLKNAGSNKWIPTFIDYLFVAFNTSTAFSPTDTPVLSRRCKMLSMAQASISLVVLAVLAARAVNIL